MYPVKPIPILTYHQIQSAPARGEPMRSLYVSPAAFARQMQILKVLGFKGLSMTDLMPYLRGERSALAERVVGITFDDGYLNNLENAAPVLKEYGFTSTCYVVSGLIGKTNSWDADLGVASAPLMNHEQLRAWLGAGQEIGSHTQSHSNLLHIDTHRAAQEIAQSKLQLEQDLGVSVQQFCYPYGDYNSGHVKLVEQAGYLGATTTKRGRVAQGFQASLLELPRVPIVRSTSWLQFLLKIATPYEDKHR